MKNLITNDFHEKRVCVRRVNAFSLCWHKPTTTNVKTMVRLKAWCFLRCALLPHCISLFSPLLSHGGLKRRFPNKSHPFGVYDQKRRSRFSEQIHSCSYLSWFTAAESTKMPSFFFFLQLYCQYLLLILSSATATLPLFLSHTSALRLNNLKDLCVKI